MEEEFTKRQLASKYGKYFARSFWIMIAIAVLGVIIFYIPLPLGPVVGFVFALFAMLVAQLGLCVLGFFSLTNVIIYAHLRFGRKKLRFSTSTHIFIFLYAFIAIIGVSYTVIAIAQQVIAYSGYSSQQTEHEQKIKQAEKVNASWVETDQENAYDLLVSCKVTTVNIGGKPSIEEIDTEIKPYQLYRDVRQPNGEIYVVKADIPDPLNPADTASGVTISEYDIKNGRIFLAMNDGFGEQLEVTNRKPIDVQRLVSNYDCDTRVSVGGGWSN